MAFKEMKIKVQTPEKSEAVQKLLFGLGYVWEGDKEGRVQNTNSKALFADYRGKITHMPRVDDYFDNHRYPEYSFRNGILREVGGEGEVVAVTYAPIVDTPASTPLGLKPRATHDKMRMLEILEAMHRYVKADKKIPYEWNTEFGDLKHQFSE